MIVRALFTLVVLFVLYTIYQRIFLQKRCVACGKHIARRAAICHYCNTIQHGIELVQAPENTSDSAKPAEKPRRGIVIIVVLLFVFAAILAIGLWWVLSPQF